MLNVFFNHKIVIVGAGNFCVRFLKQFFRNDYTEEKPEIIGIADKNPLAPGIAFAKELGIPTTMDYREFVDIDGIEIILEMSNDPTLTDEILTHTPDHVRVVDHYLTRTLFDLLLLRKFRDIGFEKIRSRSWDHVEIKRFLDKLVNLFADILQERNKRSRQIVRDLWEQEETVSQIIQGSTIPTFVINKHHEIIHWNKALEMLTGVPASEMIGTQKQWFPFYNHERPSLADLLLDGADMHEAEKFYGTGWNPSVFIPGAYQAEAFFKNIGDSGKWLFFTAAPIKSRSGKIIGAIETFWDTTEDKRLAEKQALYTQELSTLLKLYTALSSPFDFEKRIDEAFRVIRKFMDAGSVCIFLQESPEAYALRYHSGDHTDCSEKDLFHIARLAEKNRLLMIDRYDGKNGDAENPFNNTEKGCLIYVPISGKEQNPFGIIQISSRMPSEYNKRKKEFLELMGNRIGVAIENALLQEQFLQSEEKYQILFNNDPTPIFILDRQNGKIIDMNQRAVQTYGYSLDEMKGRYFRDLGDADDDEIASALTEVGLEKSLLLTKKRHYRKNRDPFYVTVVISAAEYLDQDILIVNTADITESLEKEAQLIQAGKMTTLGVMAAGMAHEINQPLNVIQVCADYFLKTLKKGGAIPPDDLKKMTLNIAENVDRASKVIKRVRDFARQTEIVRNKIDINRPIKDSINVVNHSLEANNIKIHADLAESLPPIIADHNRLEQVFINLITNAMDAIEEKVEKYPDQEMDKTITIKSFFEKGNVVMTVSDTGAGMSEFIQEKIFEPFFTTKKTGKGTGLGVSISYGIVKDYDGKIEVNSKVDKGTTFKVSFPPESNSTKEST